MTSITLSACEWHAKHPPVGTLPEARAIVSRLTAAERAHIASGMSMGQARTCCPSGAHARFLTASAFRTES